MRSTNIALLATGLAVIACSEDDAGLDAAVRDAGPPRDAGTRDSGPSRDGGVRDAGPRDSGLRDSGPRDGGPPLDSGCVAANPSAQPEYVQLQDPSRPRFFHAAGRLPNGYVLLAGGFSDGIQFDPDTEVFDSFDDSIFPGPDRPFGFANADGVTLPDGRIFITSQAGEATAIFDPADTSWTETATSPNIFGSTLVALRDNRVLSIGGRAPIDAVDDVHVFNPVANEWSLFLRLTEARVGPASAMLDDGRILVAGGSSGNGDGSLTTELIDVANVTSTPGPLMREARTSAVALLMLDRRVLVHGGHDLNGRATEIYDPALDTFESLISAPTRVVGGRLALLCDGRIAQVGGRNPTNPSGMTNAWLFDPARERWTMTNARMPTRQDPSATLLEDGRVLVFGGGLLGGGAQPVSAFAFVPD